MREVAEEVSSGKVETWRVVEGVDPLSWQVALGS
jgi:hypothetical protein